jgi:hypothetical protein
MQLLPKVMKESSTGIKHLCLSLSGNITVNSYHLLALKNISLLVYVPCRIHLCFIFKCAQMESYCLYAFMTFVSLINFMNTRYIHVLGQNHQLIYFYYCRELFFINMPQFLDPFKYY